MPEYSPLVSLFICIHLLSLLLLSILIYIILNNGSFITKWTLFQLCICLLILSISSLPSIMIFGNSLQDKALDSPFCIIQNKIMTFIYFPLKLFPIALYIYLWFAVARFNYNLEKKWFWYFSGLIWVLSIVISAYDLITQSKEVNWGVQPGPLFCKSVPSDQLWLSNIIPTSIFAIVSTVVTVHSGYILWNRWRNFNQKKNRRTAIDLGYSVRLTVLCAFYSIIILAATIPSFIMRLNVKEKEKKDSIALFMDFSPSFFGIILFMIFGTTKSAATFLPCCYYIPPKRKNRQESALTDKPNSQKLPIGLREPIELDEVIIRPESSGTEEGQPPTIPQSL